MTPVQALERIAYILERNREPTYRVKAFRNAAETIRTLSLEELQRMAAGNALEKLPGVGEKTARVIAEALAGETPAYLRQLLGDEPTKEAAAGDALRAALKGDCHTHSDWSDGGSPIREMAETAKALGHQYMALTDHSPRLTVANGLTIERLRQQLEIVRDLNRELAPFRILTGIEVDINEDGTLDQTDEILAELDLVVASVHSKLRMESEGMTARMVAAVSHPHVDVLGHCTGRLVVGRGRPESTFDAQAVFGACAQHHTAVEINSRPERLDPPDNLLAIAAELGCQFMIDTDAHAPGQLKWQYNGCDKAAGAGLGPERIVNSRALPEFLAWTERRG